MSSKEYRERVQKTERIIGDISLYAMVFIVAGLISTLVRLP